MGVLIKEWRVAVLGTKPPRVITTWAPTLEDAAAKVTAHFPDHRLVVHPSIVHGQQPEQDWPYADNWEQIVNRHEPTSQPPQGAREGEKSG